MIIKSDKNTKFKALIFIFLILIIYLVFFVKIEVVAPGQGLTGIKESNVSLKSPSSSYVVNLLVSEGEAVSKNQPLLIFRNLQDEYQLEEVSESLAFDLKLLEEYKLEQCFLVSDIFTEGNKDIFNVEKDNDCKGVNVPKGTGGQYILNFYQDYLQEKRFILELDQERRNKLSELVDKKELLSKKREILIRGGGETLRLYELDSELIDLNSEIISFSILDLESNKDLIDKFMVFQMRRSERMLTLDEKIREIEMSIVKKKYQKLLLTERKENSMLRSPIDGSVLELTEGISKGTFVQEGSPIFVLKKKGASQEVIAKFDSRYRYFLEIDRPVKIMTNSTGFSQTFSGVIKEISSDSIPYDQNQNNGERYYRVTVAPDEKFLALELNLGIDVNVMVVEKNITAFEYMSSVVPNKLSFKVW